MEAKKKPGRKAINLDHNEIERLAGMGLNERQICASLGINPSTLTRKKHIKRGKLLPRERVKYLLDDKKNIIEVGCLAGLNFKKNDSLKNK